MLTDTDDLVRVAVPVFPLGEDNSALYDFYDKFNTNVGSSTTLSLRFYQDNFFELPTFQTCDRRRSGHPKIRGCESIR